ncbi:MAG TPA: hypothetical protein VNV43_10690, partial [Candidatus Acidoferrales bacterium]|nr:hypothetical protein [Candidatus Acidoferrales bacterium]
MSNLPNKSDKKALMAKLVRRAFGSLLVVPMALFIPAGTLEFWQGWAFIIAAVVLPFCVAFYFYFRDPEVLGRRLL